MMRLIVMLVVIAFFLTGCASTKVNEEWKDPGYQGHSIRSAMVVGFPANSVVGNMCVDQFVSQLGKRGVSATPGYSALPANAPKEAAIAKARELGLDAMLVCRFLERRTQLDVYPRENQSMMLRPEYELWGPNEYVENKYDVFGTMLYETATGKTIWSAVSDTFAGRSEKKVLESYVKTMLKKMEQQGLVGPERGK